MADLSAALTRDGADQSMMDLGQRRAARVLRDHLYYI